MQFLVIQTAFIGDVVLATGIIEKLHRHFPDAEIDFMVRKGNEGLLKNHPFLREVLVWDKRSGQKNRNLLKLLRQVRSRRYDKVINVQRFAATGLLTAFSGAKETIGFDKNPFSRFFTKRVKHIISDGATTRHEIERNDELIRSFVPGDPMKPRLYPSQADYEKVKPYQEIPYLTISPASVWFTKMYPAGKWALFLQKLPPIYNIYLLGGPGDASLADSIKEAVPNAPVTNLCGQLNFLQSTALMHKAVMNYVNDSAPMHFASAVNAPVTAVYCSTLPSFGFGPLSDKRFIVEIEEPLPCRPCGLHGRKTCPLGHFKCAYNIKEDQLLETIAARES
ncbi:glycosyltransferase family 9 protein [Paraflavitalea soli]|uniref:Glycosyltransferase family 9 protein n=1 Tax=Paraflavitalea soli TaxID=2315862 RepID=A0A3B7MXU0_9BACT|nr:glycosyltransferase family 9 protein [Paraflavitalea soli]AXY78049.1 glycosyltransferase family 9 protein [Paraflavitalea soli]